MNRREFLKKTLLSSSVLLASKFDNNLLAQTLMNANTNSEDPHLLLVLRINGGWDTLMTFDCRTKEEYTSSKFTNSEFFAFDNRFGSKKHGDCYLGNVFAPMYPYLDDMAIVNGLMMNYGNSVHEINRAYMTSGNQDSSSNFATFTLAQALSKGNTHRVAYRMEYEPLLDGGYSQKVAAANLTSYKANQTDPYQSLITDEDEISSFQKNILMENSKEQKSIESMVTYIEQLTKEINPSSEGHKQASYAIAGLASGFLKSAQIDFVNDGELDTHSGHQSRQNSTLTSAFTTLAKLIAWMKKTPYKNDPSIKKSVFDVTTILITSEFSRTAWPEGGDGTSHNQFNNSCLLLGKNVNGGKVIGKSEVYKASEITSGGYNSMYHAAPFDFKAQKALSKMDYKKIDTELFGVCKGEQPDCLNYIFPETIWRTIAYNFGVDNLPGIGKGPMLKTLFK